ncbi:uncharacterized protein METZ01_LOCUS270843 [marine metagenome]|uniref:Uncharacterized protein n=1 Tax=marine metagenome TaxID=408172 RepID=A0A382K1L7_9ZZZZ
MPESLFTLSIEVTIPAMDKRVY